MVAGTVTMGNIEKQAGFYRPYLVHDRGRVPLTMALVTGVAVWLLVYLLSVVGPAPSGSTSIAKSSGSTLSLRTAAGAADRK